MLCFSLCLISHNCSSLSISLFSLGISLCTNLAYTVVLIHHSTTSVDVLSVVQKISMAQVLVTSSAKVTCRKRFLVGFFFNEVFLQYCSWLKLSYPVFSFCYQKRPISISTCQKIIKILPPYIKIRSLHLSVLINCS